MDIIEVGGTIIDFLKLLIPLIIISFIAYKVFSPAREALAEKYELSWIKSAALLNFIILFVALLIFFSYFVFAGTSSALIISQDASVNPVVDATQYLVGLVRVAIAAAILSACLLFFEMLASFFIGGEQKTSSRRAKKNTSPLIGQLIGVSVSCIVFLILLLFVFDWVPLGLFIFVFYGGVSALPLLAALI